MMMEHIWIDCDPGIDDSVMLALAAAHRNVLCIHGISTVAGNQGSDLVTDNALRVAWQACMMCPLCVVHVSRCSAMQSLLPMCTAKMAWAIVFYPRLTGRRNPATPS